MHGAITDINIWSSLLSPQQISDWSLCRVRSLGGDHVDWRNVRLKILLREVYYVDYDEFLDETCFPPTTQTISAFKAEKGLEDSRKFCENIGGSIAIARDLEMFLVMNETFSDVCEEDMFYSGHTDYDNDGRWEEAGGGERMGWRAWRKGEPDQAPLENCVTISKVLHSSYNFGLT